MFFFSPWNGSNNNNIKDQSSDYWIVCVYVIVLDFIENMKNSSLFDWSTDKFNLPSNEIGKFIKKIYSFNHCWDLRKIRIWNRIYSNTYLIKSPYCFLLFNYSNSKVVIKWLLLFPYFLIPFLYLSFPRFFFWNKLDRIYDWLKSSDN